MLCDLGWKLNLTKMNVRRITNKVINVDCQLSCNLPLLTAAFVISPVQFLILINSRVRLQNLVEPQDSNLGFGKDSHPELSGH